MSWLSELKPTRESLAAAILDIATRTECPGNDCGTATCDKARLEYLAYEVERLA